MGTIISILLICFVSKVFGQKPSSGCGKTLPLQPHPGHHHKFNVNYEDKSLGTVKRNYILQIPKVNFGSDPNINDWISRPNKEPLGN